MSDGEVRAAIAQMEAWVADPSWIPDSGALACWNAGFQLAMDRAEKGQGWPELMARAHAVGQLLAARTSQFEQLRESVRTDLEVQERGSRALRGYGASTG